MVPCDNGAETLLELLELCEDGQRADLIYPDFAHRHHLQLAQDNQIAPKKVRKYQQTAPVHKIHNCEIIIETHLYDTVMFVRFSSYKLAQQTRGIHPLLFQC